MGPADDLDMAVHAARAATHELLGVLIAHQMVPGLLNLRLVPHWPTPVRAAYLHWEEHINDLTDLLTRQGDAESTQPNGNDRVALIIRACVLGLDLEDPPA